ncbi:DUF4123 domain-containing protein [Amphritea sp.]|uniref:DUF4123 domain-containing protein n=1 Tax=Amphritea sp. TaxID=1872502 RepID=UPI003D10E6FA
MQHRVDLQIDIEQFQNELFNELDLKTYAVIDGAQVSELQAKLSASKHSYVCLWSGELDSDLKQVAPYLVQLKRDSNFTLWLLENGWANNWNIFVSAKSSIKMVRKHLRKFLTVVTDDGETLIFRFYDPRIMKAFMRNIDGQQSQQLFQDIVAFRYENPLERELVSVKKISDELIFRQVAMN